MGGGGKDVGIEPISLEVDCSHGIMMEMGTGCRRYELSPTYQLYDLRKVTLNKFSELQFTCL